MASMLSLGVQPSEALMLMEYEEVGHFIKLVQKQSKNEELKELLAMNEAFTMGIIGTKSKLGASKLNTWRSNLATRIKGEDVQKETLFTVMKKKFKGISSKSNLKKLRGM